MAKHLRVALLIESSRAFGRGLLHGIAAYSRTYGPWVMYHHERMVGDAAPARLKDWKPDALIARIESRHLLAQVRGLGLPTVDLFGRYRLQGIPSFMHDPRTAGRLGAEHFMERGFRNFAFCGLSGVHFSEQRGKWFQKRLAECGFEVSAYKVPREPQQTEVASIELLALKHYHDIADWLSSLAKPVGIMVCNDPLAQQLLNICDEIGITVPDEAAVLGVDNDKTVCELSNPPLSSVWPNTHKMGFEGAATLDRMMNGEKPPSEPTLIESLGVVTRQSTDIVAIPDEDTVAAVQFIREHACEGIGVEDVLRRVMLSRSTLERRFSVHLQRTPREEIDRVRLEKAKQLLASTDLSLMDIAPLCGFIHVETMCTFFKKRFGQTPGMYRRQTRIASPPDV